MPLSLCPEISFFQGRFTIFSPSTHFFLESSLNIWFFCYYFDHEFLSHYIFCKWVLLACWKAIHSHIFMLLPTFLTEVFFPKKLVLFFFGVWCLEFSRLTSAACPNDNAVSSFRVRGFPARSGSWWHQWELWGQCRTLGVAGLPWPARDFTLSCDVALVCGFITRWRTCFHSWFTEGNTKQKQTRRGLGWVLPVSPGLPVCVELVSCWPVTRIPCLELFPHPLHEPWWMLL